MLIAVHWSCLPVESVNVFCPYKHTIIDDVFIDDGLVYFQCIIYFALQLCYMLTDSSYSGNNSWL